MSAAECPDCGHGWDYHGPEVPGCCECRCLLTLTSGRRIPTAEPAPAPVAGGEASDE